MIELTADTEFWLRTLALVATLLLVPVAVLAMVLLVKLLLLLHSVHEFVKLARYELGPVLQEVRQLAEALGTVGDVASSNFKKLQEVAGKAVPLMDKMVKLLQGLVETGIDEVRSRVSGASRYYRPKSRNSSATVPTNASDEEAAMGV